MSSLLVGASNTTTVDLAEDYGDITFLGWTSDDNVQVQYKVDLTPFSTISTTTPTATGSSPIKTASTATTNANASGTGRMIPGVQIATVLVGCLALALLSPFLRDLVSGLG